MVEKYIKALATFPLLPKVCVCSMCGNDVSFMLATGT